MKLIEEIDKEIRICERAIEAARKIIAVEQKEIENYADRKTMLEGLKEIAMEVVENDT